ncbi:DUF4340 domain-containing protein [Immundisolibacter sp.]|uniref:DUF4340 domain-containing protein n=1 Tax=Immundisolibacter sp. TaxID=1934948 RepID=UPI0035680694
MRGRLWLNLLLLLAVAGVGTVAWLQPGKTPKPVAPKLTTIDAATVRRIEFSPPRGQAFALLREGKDWFIEQPRLRAQPFRVDTILELLSADSTARIDPADGTDKSFGVDPPLARLRFDATEIAFGLTNPVGMRRYVRVGDAVHLIDDRYYHHAASQWPDWVDRRLLPQGVTLTTLELPGFTLNRPDTTWQISPERPHATADAISALVEEWQRAYAMDVEEAETVPTDAQAVRVVWKAGALELAIARDDDEWLLYRRDAPVRYRFSGNQGKRLLEIQDTAPQTAPGPTPADIAPVPTPADPASAPP